jgi:hypothetical protein
MNEDGGDLVERLHREAIERIIQGSPDAPPGPPVRDEVDLPDAAPDSPVVEEWNLFRREVGRLIREGARGRFALVKVGQPITVWDTLRDAVQAGDMLFGQAPALVQEIQPYLRSLHRWQR